MKARHYPSLPQMLEEYAESHDIFFAQYSEYHMRLILSELVCLDIWTTAKYYFVSSDYRLLEAHIRERAGEKGFVPTKRKELVKWLDMAFYPLEFI